VFVDVYQDDDAAWDAYVLARDASKAVGDALAHLQRETDGFARLAVHRLFRAP
jgi:hypothetical protein